MDYSDGQISFSNKGNDLPVFSYKNGFSSSLTATTTPKLDTENYFNSKFTNTYFKWKDGTPEEIKEECYENIINIAKDFQAATNNMVKNMSEPGTTSDITAYFQLNTNNPSGIPIKGGKLSDIINDKNKFINEFILQYAYNNYHYTSGNSKFVDQSTNQMLMSNNIYLGDQSVYEHHLYSGAFPNSTAVCSIAMAEKATINM